MYRYKNRTRRGFFYGCKFILHVYHNKRSHFYSCLCDREEIPSSQALQILGQFDSEEISGTIRETRRYRIRKNGEELFQYYRQKHPKLFEKQRLYTYEELKHRAVDYCSSHLMIHM